MCVLAAVGDQMDLLSTKLKETVDLDSKPLTAKAFPKPFFGLMINIKPRTMNKSGRCPPEKTHAEMMGGKK